MKTKQTTVATLIIVCACFMLYFCFKGVNYYITLSHNASAYGLISNVAAFASKHGRLPFNWDEFVQWEGEVQPEAHYQKAKLEKSFKLAWGEEAASVKGGETLLFVNEPEWQRFQIYWNRALVRQVMVYPRQKQLIKPNDDVMSK